MTFGSSGNLELLLIAHANRDEGLEFHRRAGLGNTSFGMQHVF